MLPFAGRVLDQGPAALVEAVDAVFGDVISVVNSEAIVQFPMPIRPNGRPDMEKQRLSVDAVRTAVTSITEAGWNPTSRGKPMVFDVDADGN